MSETIHTALAGWGDFYLLTGTAAAALTGLQFVVQTLIASDQHRTADVGDAESGVAAFGTPTVVHFSMVLVVSAVACIPWSRLGGMRLVLAVLGLAAFAYSGVVLRRARRQRSYVPALEDWVFHVGLPALAYAALTLTAALLERSAEVAMLVAAGATLLLLLVGIHNAWDTVTYLTLTALTPAAPRAATGSRGGAGRRPGGRRR
jgi:hypothetical protein